MGYKLKKGYKLKNGYKLKESSENYNQKIEKVRKMTGRTKLTRQNRKMS